MQDLGDFIMKKFAKKPATKSHRCCHLIASDSSVRASFQTAIKLNFYFHRKEFRRKKGQINEEKPGISWQLAISNRIALTVVYLPRFLIVIFPSLFFHHPNIIPYFFLPVNDDLIRKELTPN